MEEKSFTIVSVKVFNLSTFVEPASTKPLNANSNLCVSDVERARLLVPDALVSVRHKLQIYWDSMGVPKRENIQ